MGSMEVPSQSSDTFKVPTAHYEFGANFLDPKVCIFVFFFNFFPAAPFRKIVFFNGWLCCNIVVDACWKGTD